MTTRFFSQRLFAISLLLSMFMVGVEVSWGLSFFCLILLLWKFGAEYGRWKVIPPKITGVLSVVLLLQVLLQYRTFVGQEPAFHFLLGLAALKVMDYKNSRDHKFLVLLGFILISVKALFNMDIYWLIPSVGALLGLWYSLLPEEMQDKRKVLWRVILVSLPLMLFLFFAFPRINVPWAIPRTTVTGQIGFSDQLNPGSISAIASTNQIAFRAKLTFVPLLKTEELYWRGLVLNTSQGLSWRPGLQVPVKEAPFKEELRDLQSMYEVALETTGQNYLFVLQGTSYVEMQNESVMAWEGGVFRSRRALNKTAFYRAYYDRNFKASLADAEPYLRHPPLEARIQKWVDQVKSESRTAQERLAQLQKFFSQSGFRYTLTPGTYGDFALEEFLFERRLGFCEHFAGAYATLARALGIPSRVVLGYQGGVYNPLGDFWKVGQRDAHAWVEIAPEGEWQLVDPTRWVAPLRFAIGGEAFFSLSDVDQQAFSHTTKWPSKEEGIWEWIRDISFAVEDLNYRWNYFLLEFDLSSQVDFLQYLLLSPKTSAFIFALFMLFSIILWRRFMRTPQQDASRAERVLRDIELWGAKKGFKRQSGQTPLHYLQELQQQFPQFNDFWIEFICVYRQEIYSSDNADSSEFVLLRRRWRKLRMTSLLKKDVAAK